MWFIPFQGHQGPGGEDEGHDRASYIIYNFTSPEYYFFMFNIICLSIKDIYYSEDGTYMEWNNWMYIPKWVETRLLTDVSLIKNK